MKLYEDLRAEVEAMQKDDLHPKVVALVQAFLNYLKEPRYQNPLSVGELSRLFSEFYDDLNSLVLDIYTQLNSNKRLLIQQSIIFSADDTTYDYLNAIANYSSNSLSKLLKRSDPSALYQLRVFTYYKFLTVCKSIDLAQTVLFSSTAPSESIPLYQKLLRYDLRDIAFQELITEKIHILRNLNLSIECFFESSDFPEFLKINQFFMTLEDEQPSSLADVKAHFAALSALVTPQAKLLQILRIQKSLISLCSALYEKDSSKVSNDVLLPALIYIVIYYLPHDKVELYLNLKFVKSFWNMMDPDHMSVANFSLSSSVAFYNPTNRKIRKLSSLKNLFELLNLVDSEEADFDAIATDKNEEFRSNASIVDLIQAEHLNNGELQFYLTNFEAILFFLQQTPILEMVPRDFTIPSRFAENELIYTSVQLIVDREAVPDLHKMSGKSRAELFDEEIDVSNRSRSSSLFNTISSAVSHTVRSRSNSSALKSTENKEAPQIDFEDSISAAGPSQDVYRLNQVKGLLGKIGLVSNYQFKAPVEIEVDSPDKSENRTKRSQSILDRISPSHSGTRLESENASAAIPRKSTMLSTKWSNGVSEFMNKISTAATSATSTNDATLTASHPSHTSLHSIEDPFEDSSRKFDYGIRSSSAQTMDKWLNNIPANSSSASLLDSKSHENEGYRAENNDFSTTPINGGSVFSASFGELTKYKSIDFESLTINDLKNLKRYYDQLCAEVLMTKTESKTSNDYLEDKEDA